MTTNLKPADELISIRQGIKKMQHREKEIKDGMLDGSLSLDGDFSLAKIQTRKSNRFDRKLAEKELGDLSRFCVEGEARVLLIEELDNPDVLE